MTARAAWCWASVGLLVPASSDFLASRAVLSVASFVVWNSSSGSSLACCSTSLTLASRALMSDLTVSAWFGPEAMDKDDEAAAGDAAAAGAAGAPPACFAWSCWISWACAASFFSIAAGQVRGGREEWA